MKKYCILPINYKKDETSNYIVRCILIEYKRKTGKYFSDILGKSKVEYYNTKLIHVDKYFLEIGHTFIYLFLKNKYKTAFTYKKGSIKTRRYHRYPEHYLIVARGKEFKANSDLEAVNYFKEYISSIGGSCINYMEL